MNRVVRQLHRRRCALKNHQEGGGLAVNTLAPFSSSNEVPIESRAYTNECYDQFRPGEIRAQPHPELAQTAMAGGSRACGCSMWRGRGGSRRASCGVMRGGVCPCALGRKRGGSLRSRRASCGVMRGGSRRTHSTRRNQRGGNKGGFGVDPTLNVGGNGPNAAPANVPIPCDARAGAANPFAVNGLGADPRAAMGYSLTPNTSAPIGMKGGALQGYDYTPADGKLYVDTRTANFAYASTQAGGRRTRRQRQRGRGYGGNAYAASCYKAPGSEMPVYPAQTAGFDFSPSTAAGASYSDGVTPFMEVNHVNARMGGGSRRHRKANRRHRKASRRSRKANRKAHRKSRKTNRKSRKN